MKILVLTPVLPFPPHDGDRVRLYNFIRELSRKHSVILVSFVRDGESGGAGNLSKFCKKIYTSGISGGRIKLNIMASLASGEPVNAGAFRSEAMAETAARAVQEEKPDVLFVYRLRMARYAEAIKLPKIIDMVDALSLFMKRQAKTEKRPARKLYAAIDGPRLREYEKKTAGIFDYVTVNSEEDAEYLGAGNVVVVPNGGYEIPAGLKRRTTGAGRKKGKNTVIGFFGNMEYAPNSDAAVYFYKNIWKKIENSVKNVRLVVLGDRRGKIRAALKGRGIIVKGYVKNIKKEISGWDLAVVPVRYGAGRQNKILEAWACGVPVVATDFAARGVYGKNGYNLISAANSGEFVNGVLNVLSDEKLRNKLKVNGEKTLVKNFSWKKSAGIIESLFKKAKGGRK